MGTDYTYAAYLIYEETCICDTPLCNVQNDVMDFYCHGGDFNLLALKESPNLLNETHSCYTNREQCFIMVYKGEYKPLNRVQLNKN